MKVYNILAVGLVHLFTSSSIAQASITFETVAPSLITCPVGSGDRCCGISDVVSGVYDFERPFDAKAYCNNACTEQGHQEIVSPAIIKCPIPEPFPCKDSGNNNPSGTVADGVATYVLLPWYSTLRCPMNCAVEAQSFVVQGPAQVSCTSNPDCRTEEMSLNVSSTIMTPSGDPVFEIEDGVEARCDHTCSIDAESQEIIGPARGRCPMDSVLGCFNLNGIQVVSGDGLSADSFVEFTVPESDIFRCDTACSVVEASVEVRGPATMTCPPESVGCTDTMSQGTVLRMLDVLGRCGEQCTIVEESVELKTPFKASCPQEDSVGCTDFSSTSDGMTANYEERTQGGEDVRCGKKCTYSSSEIFHGAGEISCPSGSVNCVGTGGTSSGDGSSMHSLECGQTAWCDIACTPPGGNSSGSIRSKAWKLLVLGLVLLM